MNSLMSSLLLASALMASATQLPAQTSPAADGAVVVLITAKEAALGSATSAIALASADDTGNRAITRNPKIILMSPSGAASAPLIHFEIKFQAFNNARIDPARVKLTYLRPQPLDLTPRVKAFIRPDGIDIPRAQVAAGKHLIQIDAVDTEGREVSRQLTLDVTQ
jgi:hypothetical protein